MSAFVGPEKIFADRVNALVHSDKKFEASQELDDFLKLDLRLEDDPNTYLPVLSHWLHYLLNSGRPEEAAKLLWTPTLFTPEPQFTKDVWKLFEEASRGLIMGGASVSKSYGMGVRLFLEWCRDPEWSSIKVLGPSEAHLEQNLFSHLVGLHRSASLPMPGEIGNLFIGLDRRNQLSSILGVVIPIGQQKKSGRLQGVKRKPRLHPHPVFGALSRLFIFVDEIERIPGGLWSDIDNILSNDDGEAGNFKLFAAFNPTDQAGEVGKRAEPPFGWEGFDIDNHFRWKSKRDWDVCRLDPERCENVVQNKIVYPGLQTKTGLEAIARNAGGRGSAGFHSMGRGAYPPQGIELTIFPPGLLQKCRGTYIFYDEPIAVGSVDLALEGGAACSYSLGKWGRAAGIQFPPTIEFPKGRRVMFKDRNGQSITRWGLQADQQFTIPKGETVGTAEKIIQVNRKAGVRGEYFSCDRTGAGAGVADLIRHDWSASIHDVNYSEACSKDKIMSENRKTCNEEFERMNSELWMAMKSWAEFNYLLINPAMDMTKLTPQLTQRKFRIAGGKTRIEPKIDYIHRGNESPDEADSLTLLVHAARKGAGVTLSMNLDESSDMSPGSDDFDGWQDGFNLIGGARIDESNRTQVLDDFSQHREEAIL